MFAIAAFATTSIMTHDREKFYSLYPQLSTDQLPGLKYDEFSPVLTILSVTFTRVSICFFLLRIVASGQRWQRRTWTCGLYAIMAFSIVTGVPTAIVTISQCKPIAKLWDPLLPGTCWSPNVALYFGDFYGGKFVTKLRILFAMLSANPC